MIMKFKDAYKSVNDEIHGDRALLHAILNGEAQKKKAFSFHFRPAYTAALAAMFVVAATSVYFNAGINDHTATKERGISDFKTSPSDTTLPIKDEADIALEPAPDKSSALKDTYSEDRVAKAIMPDSSLNYEATNGAADDNGVSMALENDQSASDQTDALGEYATKESSVQRQIEHAGVAASVHDLEPAYSGGGSLEEISNADYYGDAIFALQLPDDLTPLIASEQLASHEHCDPLTIVASSPSGERCVTLTFSKQDNLKALVPYAAYARLGEVYVAVSSQGLTQAETDAIIHANE